MRKFYLVLQISVGSIHLQSVFVGKPLELYSLNIPSPKYPVKGHLVVKSVNSDGKVAQAIIPVR